jgi:PAS domain S-box-containing protein
LNEIKTAAIETDSARFSRALRSAILWPAGVIIFTACLMLVMIFILLRVVKWSEHSYAVIAETRSAENEMVDMQSGVRGYLLTGDRTFQSTFAARRAKLDQDFKKLAFLVRDNPSQSNRAQNLILAKNSWFDYARTIIDQRTQGVTSDPAWMKLGDGLMNSLRDQFQTFTQVEEDLHDQRIAHVQSAKKALGFAGGALALILALTVGQLVRRQFMGLAINYRSALHTIEQRHDALARSEADLEEQKEWFRVTLSSIGDGVIVTDAEGRVVFMNHEAERLTGWNGVEALLKPLSSIFRLVDEKSRAKEEDPASRVLREQKVLGLTKNVVLLSRGGDEWPIGDTTAPIKDTAGKLLGVVLVFHDATEIRQSQNALKIHSEELEKRVTERTTTLRETVSELEAFSYTVSHDLRSPLRAMQGFAEAVIEDYGEKLDEQGRNYLGRIKNAAERLDRLIQDLLSYTRISRQNAPLTPMDADKFVRELVQHYPNLNSPSAEITIEGKLPVVLANQASLTQVFSNLLGNAIKFVPPGVVPQIRVWSESLDDRVRFWIADNGIGISQENHERIFQMFVQVNDSHLYGGTGVGLAIVRKAVESMHGTVGLDLSETGSKFWFELAKA